MTAAEEALRAALRESMRLDPPPALAPSEPQEADANKRTAPHGIQD